jgi:hypothetical protein
MEREKWIKKTTEKEDIKLFVAVYNKTWTFEFQNWSF